MQAKKSAIAVLAAATLALSACAPAADSTGSTESVEITFMNSVSPSFPVETWQALVDEFEKANPDIKVNMLTPPSADRDVYAKTLLAAGNFPDVSYGLSIAQFRDELLPFDLSDPDVQRLQNADSMLDGGELYQLGTEVQPWNTIFYNKDLYSQAGIDSVPTTRAEFEVVLQKLKAAGITPILTAGEWVPVVTWLALFPIFSEEQCWYGEREKGNVHFTDENWLEAGAKVQEWWDAGYFNDGALGIGYTQVEQQFVAGEGAMYPMGSWFIGSPQPDFPVGAFAMPTKDGAGPLSGSVGSVGMTVSKTSEFTEQAVKLAKFLSFDPVAVKARMDAGAIIGVDLDSPIEVDRTPVQQDVQDMVEAAPSFYTTFNGQGDCNLRGSTQAEINTAVQAMWTGTSPKEALAKVDEYWDSAE